MFEIPAFPQFNLSAPQLGQAGGAPSIPGLSQLPQMPFMPQSPMPGLGQSPDLMSMLAGSQQRIQQMAQQAATIPTANRPMLESMRPFMEPPPAPTVGSLAQPRRSVFAGRDRDRSASAASQGRSTRDPWEGLRGTSGSGGTTTAGGSAASRSSANRGGSTTAARSGGGGGFASTPSRGPSPGSRPARASLDIRSGSPRASIEVRDADTGAKASGKSQRSASSGVNQREKR